MKNIKVDSVFMYPQKDFKENYVVIKKYKNYKEIINNQKK